MFLKQIRDRLCRFWRDERSGFAATELAISLPVILLAGGYGVELANYSIVNLTVSQAALNLADNASRVGAMTALSVVQLRESDLNDVLQGTRLQGGGIHLTTFGRITISSLEDVQQSWDAAPVQRIHWQRCVGMRSGTGYDSSYGTTQTTDGITANSSAQGTPASTGMGDPGYMVNVPAGSGLMFVEINYDYQPLFSSMFISSRKIHYIASLIVRDKRDFSQIYNPSPVASRATCDQHTS